MPSWLPYTERGAKGERKEKGEMTLNDTVKSPSNTNVHRCVISFVCTNLTRERVESEVDLTQANPTAFTCILPSGLGAESTRTP